MGAKTDALIQIFNVILTKFPALLLILLGAAIWLYPVNTYYLEGLLPKLFIGLFYMISSLVFALMDPAGPTMMRVACSNFLLFFAIFWQFTYIVYFGTYRKYPISTCDYVPDFILHTVCG